MDIEKIIELIEQHGISFLITAIALSFVIRYFNRKMNEKPKTSIHQDFPFDYSIQSHSILSTLEYFYTSTVHSLCFKSQFKQLLWTDFLVAYFQAMHESVTECLQQSFHELPQERFKREIRDWMINLAPYCDDRVRQDMKNYFVATERTPDPINLIITKFNKQFRYNHGLFFQFLSEYTETAAFPSNKQRLAAILYALKAFAAGVIMTCEQTLSLLNGDLVGLSYKGIENSPLEQPA